MPRPRKKPDAKEALRQFVPPAPDPAPADPGPTFKITPKPDALRKMVENPPPRPSVSAFLDHWFAIRGGPAAFANELSQEYDAAEPGSLVRSNIVQLVVRSMKVADAKEGVGDELGLVTDADLDRMLVELGNRLLGDATPTPPPKNP